MDDFNVDSVILENMGNGLQSVISNAAYQPASQESVQGVNLESLVGPGANAGGQAANVGGQQVLVQPQPGVTPSYPVNQPDPQAIQQQANAAVEHFRNLAFQATAERIQAEEEAFEAKIAGMQPEEQEFERVKRQLAQTQQLNEYQNRQIEGGKQQQQQMQAAEWNRRQQVAKAQWGVIVANQYGLSYDQEWVRNALSAAQNTQHMAQIAQGIAQSLQASHAANVQNQINRGVFSAGGNTASPALGPQAREGSGDLSSLIGSRGYVTVQQR